MNRRCFVHTATVGATSPTSVTQSSALAAEKANWLIGRFQRSVDDRSYDDAFDGELENIIRGRVSLNESNAKLSEGKFIAGNAAEQNATDRRRIGWDCICPRTRGMQLT